jgi:hypothetical protein
MGKLTRDGLMGLEEYAQRRQEFRQEVMEHKKDRRVALGPNANLYFEDQLTMQYQVQEMLRIEKIFEPEAIQEELDAYNPLIPDGNNWKATFMIEYADVEERKRALERLVGVEDRVWVRVESHEPVFAIADEDLERETADKTSSVHFLRFELDPEMAGAVKGGARLAMGVSHDNLELTVDPVPDNVRDSLAADLA